jgi:hypothetical protein
MQAIAYEGYFDNGHFYSAGKAVRIPENQRVIITVLGDWQGTEANDLHLMWPTAESLEAMAEARRISRDPAVKGYRNIDDFFKDLDADEE